MRNQISRLLRGEISAIVLLTGLLAAVVSAGAFGATTTTVVDVPVNGATQRFLYLVPDAPTANIIALPGGDGILGIQNDGTLTTFTASCGPVIRNRQAFVDRSFALALVDQTSAGSVGNFNDVLEVARYMRERHNVPTWVIGGSASTNTTATLSVNLPRESGGGVIFYSPGRPNSSVSLITRPTLVVTHSSDADQFGAAFFTALTAASVKERIAFTGGSNAGCGYHLFNGVDAEFIAATTSFISKYNVSTTAQLNFQGLWWKSPAASESGWGINFAHQGDVIFATWFTYDATGKALWLSMTANKTSENVYTGTFVQTRGPAFNAVPFSPAAVTVTTVGSGSLTFSDANNGNFAYTINGISQTKPITRQVFGPLPTCTFGAQTNLALATNYQDLWWAAPDGVESGWGVNFTHQADTIFATWFTYDLDGSPLWLSATTSKSGVGIYQGTLYRTTGPPFNAVPFLPANVGLNQVGTITLTFTNGNAATFAYTVNGVTQSKSITRQVFRAPGTVCQ